MPYRAAPATEGKLAIAGVVALALGGLVSIFTDDESWAWGVMILTGLAGVSLLVASAAVAVARWRRFQRS